MELREKAKKLGADPLDVMIDEIRDLLLQAQNVKDDKRLALRTQAVEVAAKLAPYLHPRLATIELTGDPNSPLQHVHARAASTLSEQEAVEEWRQIVNGGPIIEGQATPVSKAG